MKAMKKILAAMLVIILALGMVGTAFADGATTSITMNPVPGSDAIHTYEAYQIFSGTLEDGVLYDIDWGTGITDAGKTALIAWANANKGADVATITDAAGVALVVTEANAKDFADEVSKYLSDECTEIETEATEDVDAGYYFIKDKDGTVEAEEAYTKFILKVVGEETVTPKASVPKVDKEIVSGEQLVKANNLPIGEKNTYKITGTVANTIEDYKQYYYEFSDKMSKGLTYNNDAVVTIDGVKVTSFFTVVTDTDAQGNTLINIACDDILAINTVTVSKTSKVVLTYTATVNEDAVVYMPNEVKVIFSNDPNYEGEGTPEKPHGPVGETPWDTVITQLTSLKILKVDQDGKKLTGAEFTLTGENINTVVIKTGEEFVKDDDGEYWLLTDGTYTKQDPNEEGMDQTKYASTTDKYKKVTFDIVVPTEGEAKSVSATVNNDGIAEFFGLAAGDYTITESVVPAGYNEIEDLEFKIVYTVADGATTGVYTVETEDGVTVSGNATDGYVFEVTVKNLKGATLPSTGGVGTTMFYVLGGILAVGAGILLVTKKRMEG